MQPIAVNPVLFIIVVIWCLIWKGWGMWESARRGQKAWFIIILLTTSLGIIEMIYLFFVIRAHHEHEKIATNKEE